MKNTGILRNIDDMGRSVIPKELRRQFDMGENTEVEIYTNDNTIVLKRHEPNCVFCGNERDLVPYKGKLLCPECIADLKNSL